MIFIISIIKIKKMGEHDLGHSKWSALDFALLKALLLHSCSGVLMWEVYSEGRLPYENRSNTEVVESLNAGLRLLKPRVAPDTVHMLMEWCWKEVQRAGCYHFPTKHLLNDKIIIVKCF